MNARPTSPTIPAGLGVPLDDGDGDSAQKRFIVFHEDAMLSLELTNMEGLITAYAPGLRVERPDLLRPKHYYAAGRYPTGNVLLLSMRLARVSASAYVDLDDAAGRDMAAALLRQHSIPVIVRTKAGTPITLTSPQSPVKARELENILALAAENKPERRDWEATVIAFERDRV